MKRRSKPIVNQTHLFLTNQPLPRHTSTGEGREGAEELRQLLQQAPQRPMFTPEQVAEMRKAR